MNYSIVTIRRGLRNLFVERTDALNASKAGAYYKEDLHEARISIDAIPEAITSPPYKIELRTTDERHDRLGRVMYFVTEACFHDPDASLEMVAAARQIREAFIPSLDELTGSYATEAERAMKRKPLLQSLGEPLKMFVLPWDPNRTLLDVATSFLTEAEKLEGLLDERADVPKAARAQALVLRTKTMGLLNRFRKDLKKEIERDANLPRDLEQRVFGFFDTLHNMEMAGKSNESAGENKPQ
ncbi:MAG: hypothetical protein IPM54_04735 [Polyangiaceae bacterium]|nr:hypothetical protein [Polyangiaceae bacterium]